MFRMILVFVSNDSILTLADHWKVFFLSLSKHTQQKPGKKELLDLKSLLLTNSGICK